MNSIVILSYNNEVNKCTKFRRNWSDIRNNVKRTHFFGYHFNYDLFIKPVRCSIYIVDILQPKLTKLVFFINVVMKILFLNLPKNIDTKYQFVKMTHEFLLFDHILKILYFSDQIVCLCNKYNRWRNSINF